MVAVPLTVYPVCEQLLQVGKEAAFGSAPSSTAFTSVPIVNFAPDNKVTWVEDGSMWGDFTKTHDVQEGPVWAESEIKESPLYGDSFGNFAFNLMGDLTTTGTGTTPTWTSSAPPTAGGTVISVSAGSTAVSGTYIQVDTSTNSEVVAVTTGSTGTTISINPATPLRFTHGTTTTITTVVAPFTHTFSVLNPYGSTGVTTGQGPSHTFIHRTGIPGSGNNNAWQFVYGCMSEITVMGKASGILTWSGKVTSYSKAYPAFNPTPSFSAVRMIPAWKSTTTVASAQLNDITEWSCVLTRQLEVIPTADGVQAPYLIGRGNLDATFKLMYSPVLDESALTNMLTNAQPTLSWTISNGLAGSSLVSFTLNANQAAYKTVPLTGDKTFFGFDVSGDFVGNTTNSGNSGGRGPCQIVLQNAIPTY